MSLVIRRATEDDVDGARDTVTFRPEVKMIKVSVFYPKHEGSTFDMKYYCERHIPMVRSKLGTACTGAAVEEGLAGAAPGSPPAFAALGHLYFESAESFQAAFGPHAEAIIGDIPNYTNVQPTIQISQVKIASEPVATRAQAASERGPAR